MLKSMKKRKEQKKGWPNTGGELIASKSIAHEDEGPFGLEE